MTAENFQPALKRVLAHEGGYSNHPVDPGGVTLNGVIQRVYDADRQSRGLPQKRLVRGMLGKPDWIAERDSIYRRRYWNLVQGDKLPKGIDYCVFDAAVNSGPGQAARWLQRSLAAGGVYKGKIDGIIGADTLRAVEEHPNHDALIADMCARRLAMLRGLRTWSTFGKGWTIRVNSVNAGGQAWATGATPPKPAKGGGAKADTDADVKVSKTPEGKAGREQAETAGSAGLLATLFGYFDQASGYLAQLSGLPEGVTRVVVILALIAGGGYLAWRVGGAVWGWYVTWREKRDQEDDRALEAEIVDVVQFKTSRRKAAPSVWTSKTIETVTKPSSRRKPKAKRAAGRKAPARKRKAA